MLNFKSTVITHETYDHKGRLRLHTKYRNRELKLTLPLIGSLSFLD